MNRLFGALPPKTLCIWQANQQDFFAILNVPCASRLGEVGCWITYAPNDKLV